MAYVLMTRPPRPPTPEEQARAFWKVVQNLSALFSLLAAIRALSE
jgi:hypothetical protein